MDSDSPSLRAARFSDRFVAYLLDTVPFAVGAVASSYALFVPLAKPPTPERLAELSAAWLTLAFAWQLLGTMAGGTPGKRLMGLRVVAMDGSRPGLLRSTLRALLWLAGQTLGHLGCLVALFNRRSRALHDYLSGTVVVEAYRKSAAEGAALFLAGAFCASGLLGFQLWSGWSRPTPEDLAAVARAREGLAVIALVQEAYREQNGVYASTVGELASASGDPDGFLRAMAALFSPESGRLEAGNRGWRITLRARDRRRTPVSRAGP